MSACPQSVDLEKFKLYLADTGLFVTLMFKDAAFTDNIVYENLLADKLPVNLGMVYENVVAQELTADGYGLFYHTWPKGTSNHNYEIDFIILPDGKKICPIEVKASRYKTHASLDAFADKFSSRIGRQYLVYTKDMRKDREVVCIPTYMLASSDMQPAVALGETHQTEPESRHILSPRLHKPRRHAPLERRLHELGGKPRRPRARRRSGVCGPRQTPRW